jgi:NADH-quinone oxidoreductase subunit K
MTDAPFDFAVLHVVLGAGVLVFAIGAIGATANRRWEAVWMSLGVMGQAVALIVAAWGRFHGDFDGDAWSVLVVALVAAQGLLGAAVASRGGIGALDLSAWRRTGVGRGESIVVADESPERLPTRAPEAP